MIEEKDVLDSFGIQKNNLQLRRQGTQKRIKSGQVLLMENNTNLVNAVKNLKKQSIFLNNVNHMVGNKYSGTATNRTEDGLSDFEKPVIGTKFVEINGV